jgi:hypothetical protein
MKNFDGRTLIVALALATGACSDLAGEVSGSCSGTETVAGMTVNVCSESPTLTVSNQATLNSICRSGQLGAAANVWSQGVSCTASGRVGGCRRTVNGIDVITWIYPRSATVNATVVRAFCAQIMATYVAP